MELKLQLKKRDQFGKKTRQLVNDGQVLGNVFGKGQASVAVQGDYSAVNKMILSAGTNHPIDLEIEGSDNELVLVNTVERDAITQRLHHVSFQTIKKGEKVATQVPIKLVGDSPAAKNGLILVTLMDSIEIEAIPSKIPEVLEISIEGLVEENDNISVADLKDIDDVEIIGDESLLIAKIDAPRAAEEETSEEEAEEVDAAGVPSDHGSDNDSDGDAGEAAKD